MGGGPPRNPVPLGNYPKTVQKPVGHKISRIYKERIDTFFRGDQYAKYTLLANLYEGKASGKEHVSISTWAAPGDSRPTFDEVVKQEFKPTDVGQSFGPSWSTHWFKLGVTVPERLRSKELLEFHWDSNSEAMIWSADGKPLQGLTGTGERVEWRLPDAFRDGEEHVLYVEMACNGMFGVGAGNAIFPPDPNRFFQLARAEICAVNVQARRLRLDIWIIGDAAKQLPEDSWEQHAAMDVANRIIDTFELNNQKTILQAREIAAGYIGNNVDSAKVYDSDQTPLVYGIGHCHIDTCWLWPWAETKRKVARSWTSQCNLMEQYPELNFACSQAQQFKWLKENYPYAFDRVKQKVRDGQFHPIGGSWVEHDTNMPSGESLVRQFLYGQRFFEENFGQRCNTFWLPDTFGYSSQLPQLCRLSGMNWFLTQKLSWNNINNFPHTTFNWVALDGSQVICHMPPSETYTAEASFDDALKSVTQHKSMDQDATSLMVFGKGDGGGGPTWEMLERLRRCRGVSDTVGRLPRVHMGKTVDHFFAEVEKKADKLTTWYGELYFELHRGTYTTQAKNKLANRKAEFTLRDIEMLATFASLDDKSYKYPKKEIDEMWETILLCQFHDCLPGSSIGMCYEDSDKAYDKLFQTADEVLSGIHNARGLSKVNKDGKHRTPVALNTLPWPRSEVVELPDRTLAVASVGTDMRHPHVSMDANPPYLDSRVLQTFSHDSVFVKETSKGVFTLQNSRLSVKVENGTILSLFDRREDREVLANGAKANQFVIFDDKPLFWEAWDVEVYHLDTRKELVGGATTISEDQSLRVSVTTEVRISEKSSLRTTLSLSASADSVVITTDVDWHEDHKFLKVEFPVDIHSTEASYETQFGFVKRPTHYNTSWDMAKFEVCCHKWADLSEYNYGVSILNDSKFGFATAGNTMRLSLLRSPKAPDATADMGRHSIRYAILPHQGRLGAATVRRGYEFNNPLQVMMSSKSPYENAEDPGNDYTPMPLKWTGESNPALIIDTIKRGEDDADVSTSTLPRREGRSVVVRIFESLGGRARGTVRTAWAVGRVTVTNALEDDLEDVKVKKVPIGPGRVAYDSDGEEVEVTEDGFDVELRPFEVRTYRIQIKD